MKTGLRILLDSFLCVLEMSVIGFGESVVENRFILGLNTLLKQLNIFVKFFLVVIELFHLLWGVGFLCVA